MRKVVLEENAEVININRLSSQDFIGVVYGTGERGIVIQDSDGKFLSQPIGEYPLNLTTAYKRDSLKELLNFFESDIQDAYLFKDAVSLYSWALNL